MQSKLTPLATKGVPKRWAWHYRQLEQLRARLIDGLPAALVDSSRPVEAHSMDMADSATDEFDHDMAHCILSHEQDSLYEVDAALRRILEGRYGICEESGKPISAARLRAVPWARYIREVEERLEREGSISRTRLGAVASIRKPGSGEGLQMDEPEKEERMTPDELRHQRQAEIRIVENADDIDPMTEPPPLKL